MASKDDLLEVMYGCGMAALVILIPLGLFWAIFKIISSIAGASP